MSEHIPDFDGRRALADEARRLLRAMRLTHVGDADRTKVAELLAEATMLLERDAPGEPLWHTGLTGFEGYDATVPLNRIFPFSPATGGANPVSPVMDLAVDDDGVIRGEVTFAEYHNGPPFDLVHGGVIALVYDELLGMAGMLGGGGGFTANLTVEYRRPTPLGVPLQLATWTSEPDGRKLYGHGEMRFDGELLTEARGLFIQPVGVGVDIGETAPPPA
jgi:acyl-coenzyme A thioesterase PaaI-like protein